MSNERRTPPGHRFNLDSQRSSEGQLTFDDLGTPLEAVTFVVVDLETTGGKPSLRSITEIGAVKVRGGELVGEFASLVNPGMPIPPFITALTGITTAMANSAPAIEAVLPAFIEFLGSSTDTVLVAHNARFDIGHLKAAASGMDFPWPRVEVLDTLALARRVFTREETPNFKLGTLAALCHSETSPTHRALDDARATVDVLHTMIARIGPLGVSHLSDLLTSVDPVPAHRRRKVSLAADLPRTPGVYRFIGPSDEVMYVGTSVNVYKRVRQYFTAAETRRRMAEMVDLAQRIEATSTPTVLEARVLELRQIEEFDPPFNRRSKRPAKRPWLVLTDEAHPRLKVTRTLPAEEIFSALGPFTSVSQARRAQEIICDETFVRTCTRKLPLVARPGASACHLLEMGACTGPCVGPRSDDPQSGDDTVPLAQAAAILAGQADPLWEHQLVRLAQLAKSERYEQAAIERDRLTAVVQTQKRKERLLPLLTAPLIAAACREATHWEIAIIQYGRLVETRIVGLEDDPPATAHSMITSIPTASEPERACGNAPVEETEILATWLWQENTRLLHAEGPVPLAFPRKAASRRKLPKIESLPATT